MRTQEFHNGDQMPAFGLGTWKSEPEEVYRAVKEALAIGYRHVDCAAIYGNEAEIGRALEESFAEGVVKREELWVTSKLWNDAHDPKDVEPALRKTLSDLRLEHLDLYLIHWPIALRSGVHFPESPDDMIPLEKLPLETTWSAMEALLGTGLVRHIGVSNFSENKLRALVDKAQHAPEMNQVEMHPYLAQKQMLDYAKRAGIHLTGYSPLGSKDRPDFVRSEDDPVLMEDPTITEIAKSKNASPAQVLIAWALQRGTAVIPKSVNPKRLRENFEAQQVELGDDEMKRIGALDRHRRYVLGDFWCLPESGYTLEKLWDE